MKDLYLDLVSLVERLHRLFLEVIKCELDHMGIYDINNVQAMVLYNLGKGQISVSELTNRGYYLGSNVSYNLRKMVQNGYVEQEPSPHDRRSTIVRLSAKGMELYKKIDAALNRHVTTLQKNGMGEPNFKELTSLLRRLEAYWNTTIGQFAFRAIEKGNEQ